MDRFLDDRDFHHERVKVSPLNLFPVVVKLIYPLEDFLNGLLNLSATVTVII